MTWILGLSLLGVAAGCGGDDGRDAVAAAATEATTPGLVSPEEAARLAAAGVTVIDVRTPEEYAEGHLEGATLIDFYDAGFADAIAALPADEQYLVYCRSGNRSGQAVAMMEQLGFDAVYDMDGGIIRYSAAGLPLAP